MVKRDNTQEINAGIAIALAKTASDTAVQVAKTASDTAAGLAVKTAEMSGDVTFIKGEIVALSRDIKDGFSAIHTRQDVANGRTSKSELAISNVELQKQTNVRNIADHETRLRNTEIKITTYTGALMALQFAIGLFLWFLGR